MASGFQSRRLRLCQTGVLALALASAPAVAQWTVTNLHPDGLTSSTARGVSAGQQAGSAGVWSGSAASFVNLGGQVHDVSNGVQSGRFVVIPNVRACLWTGTAASRIDLHPATGARMSEAFGTDGASQVGIIGTEPIGVPHAALWFGTAASLVDLHPAGVSGSYARGVGGGQQVGEARFSTAPFVRAALWTGTAASYVNLHPPGAVTSIAWGTNGAEQVGDVQVGLDGLGNSINHAALWRGAAASFVDLNPAGAISSFARGIFRGEQVGGFTPGNDVFGDQHACVWTGTAASMIDLHTFLPAEFTRSFAWDIYTDATHTYIVGGGYNTITERDEALMWVRTNCCRADFNCQGGLTVQDIFDYLFAYLNGDPRADFNGVGGLTVQDLFDFLVLYFAGCP